MGGPVEVIHLAKRTLFIPPTVLQVSYYHTHKVYSKGKNYGMLYSTTIAIISIYLIFFYLFGFKQLLFAYFFYFASKGPLGLTRYFGQPRKCDVNKKPSSA